MIFATIAVAALLFIVAFVVLAEACRPRQLLNLKISPPVTGRNANVQEVASRVPKEPDFGLSEEDRDGFVDMWHSVRSEFDVDPRATVLHADLLMSDLIEDYRKPLRERVLSGNGLLQSTYRSAHEIALRSKKGSVRPHELKRAISLYTALFDELLDQAELSALLDARFGSSPSPRSERGHNAA